MDRREMLRQCLLLLGVSMAGRVSALDLDRAFGAAKSLTGAATLSDEDIANYCAQLAKEQDDANRVAAPDSEYGKRLATLTEGLDSYDGMTLNFKVYETEEVNAFAMADGTVRLYSGLLDLMTDDEVRYVVGHEMGHVKAGHSRKRMQVALTTGGLRDAVAASGTKHADLADSQLGELFEKVVVAQHSQGNENEADDYAMGFMKDKNFAPAACVTALEKLDALSGGGGSNWLSTHPAPKERAARMRGQLA
ncbi:M48 family metallopeptidase [Thiosocius teredinicola]|uniref:M48 family metallopeptidase n=1 Tax=Thiosocius teredinicola TaxID=1973002 RepID=UPI000990FFA8